MNAFGIAAQVSRRGVQACRQENKITVTRHGFPAAMLIPLEATKTKLTHKEIAEGMRKQIKPGTIRVCEMLRGGRRF
jgi:antitoxin (DNA-binding transcriptional repressor) of toxin-antitoxin stability system